MGTVILAQLTYLGQIVGDPKFFHDVIEAQDYLDDLEEQWKAEHPVVDCSDRPCRFISEMTLVEALNYIKSQSK